MRGQRALSSCQQTGNGDQKNVFSFGFEFFKDFFPLMFTPALDFAMDCPLREDKMLRANAMSETVLTSAGEDMLQVVISFSYKMHRTVVTSYKD